MDEDENSTRWEILLSQDPLYELKLLAIRTMDGTSDGTGCYSGESLKVRVEELTVSTKLQAQLDKAGISSKSLREAQQEIVSSKPYEKAFQDPSEHALADYPDAIARAIVATAMGYSEQQGDAPIWEDANIRDQTVEAIRCELENDLGVGDGLFGLISAVGLWASTPGIQKERIPFTKRLVPALGDILLYQSNGHEIRRYILNCVEEADPPVVLLAHSLGGIACVDLLISGIQDKADKKNAEQMKLLKDKIKLLITVGSQAPFLYEMDALTSLRYGQPLPDYFPDWLNLYDQRDFLSYIGAPLFPNKVIDVEIESRSDRLFHHRNRFPQSHSAYWDNSKTWDTIFSRLP